jgi:hypothetical protein
MNKTMIDQREMTCEMLDEVHVAKKTARIMSRIGAALKNFPLANKKKLLWGPRG